MDKKKLLKIIGPVALLLFFGGGALVARAFLAKPQKIIISLPYSPNNPTKSILPMGETIEHPKAPNGHPGVDFQWNKPTEILASADGKIVEIKKVEEYGGVWSVKQVSGGYAILYTEMALAKEGLKVGDSVKKGDVVGISKMFFPGHSSMHWEFRYSQMWKDRLCPITYFDADSLKRITAEWEGGKRASTREIGEKFPHICSGGYYGKDE